LQDKASQAEAQLMRREADVETQNAALASGAERLAAQEAALGERASGLAARFAFSICFFV
jgi:hypothetical protein